MLKNLHIKSRSETSIRHDVEKTRLAGRAVNPLNMTAVGIM